MSAKNHYQPGDSVALREDRVPWYSGYGANPEHVVRAGTVGTVTAVDVPTVRAIPGRPRTYNVARFDGWQLDFQPSDVARDES